MEISNGPRSTFSLNALLLAALLALICPALGRGEDFVRQWTNSQFVFEQGTVGAVSAVTRTPDGDLVACGSGGVSNSREFFVARYAAETGAVRWKKQSFPGLGPNGTFYSLGTDADGNVFMSGIDETAASGTIAVVKLRGGDGAELWRRNLPGVWGFGAMTPAGDFAITTSRVTAGTQELWTAVLAGSDGATRWERVVVDASQRQFDARQIQVDPAGNVVLILNTRQVAKLAGTDGALLWIHDCNAANARSSKVRKVAADAAGRVIVSYETTLNTRPFGEHFVVTTMLAAADGTPLWVSSSNSCPRRLSRAPTTFPQSTRLA